MVNKGVFVRLESQPGKENEVEQFLRNLLSVVEQEQGTITWYAIKLGPSEYAVYGAFENEEARKAHLEGEVVKVLVAEAGDLFFYPPVIEKTEILAAKVPEMEHAHH